MDSFKVFSEDKLPDMNFLVLEKIHLSKEKKLFTCY